MLQEFKEFMNRGNLVDLAVAFILGVAFSKVVDAFTTGVVGGIIGAVFGSTDGLKGMHITVNDSPIRIGLVLDAALNFIIVAFVLFLIVKAYNSMRKAAPPAGPSEEVKLLSEIRDSLKRS